MLDELLEELPLFPDSTPILLSHAPLIQKYTAQFDPYSDFNFTSMWNYNTENLMSFSQLHGNLVVKFTDYVTNEEFFSFLGINKVEETALALIEEATKKKIVSDLFLIPEVTAVKLLNSDGTGPGSVATSTLEVTADPDNHDHIFIVKDLVGLQGGQYEKKRWRINKFNKTYPNVKYQRVDMFTDALKKQYFDVFDIWKATRSKSDDDTRTERIAVERFFELEATKSGEMVCVSFFDTSATNNRLIGFSLNEKINDEYGMGHFIKGSMEYRGIFEYMYNSSARIFDEIGVQKLNLCQDLGIDGLRTMKESWHPSKLLKKYIIKKK